MKNSTVAFLNNSQHNKNLNVSNDLLEETARTDKAVEIKTEIEEDEESTVLIVDNPMSPGQLQVLNGFYFLHVVQSVEISIHLELLG